MFPLLHLHSYLHCFSFSTPRWLPGIPIIGLGRRLMERGVTEYKQKKAYLVLQLHCSCPSCRVMHKTKSVSFLSIKAMFTCVKEICSQNLRNLFFLLYFSDKMDRSFYHTYHHFFFSDVSHVLEF